MIYAYIRVSTDKQTVENQRFEIENYCRKRQIDVDQYIEETISGMKDVDKRKLGTLLKKMKKDDTLIASEISRLGRRLLEVMSILDNLMKKKIRVITVKEGFEVTSAQLTTVNAAHIVVLIHLYHFTLLQFHITVRIDIEPASEVIVAHVETVNRLYMDVYLKFCPNVAHNFLFNHFTT